MIERDEPRNKQGRCAIAIMAKAPGAGRVKTRLSPLLTPDEARDLGACFLRDMTENLALAAREAAIDPHIAFAPAGSETAFATIVAPGTQFVLADGSHPAPPGIEGLGRCLIQAASGLHQAGYEAVGLLNADSPTLPTALLVRAARLGAERENRVVLGPCLDGGYYLIAMRAPHAELFRAIDWSTDRVADQTRMRADEAGLDLVELDAWYDVDDAESLRRLITELQDHGTQPNGPTPYAAPVTARWIRERRIHARLAPPPERGSPPRSAAGADRP
jgi:rSAM/selenodomain-associated transferase 1